MSLPVQNLSSQEINPDEKWPANRLFYQNYSIELMSLNLLTHYAKFGHSQGTKIAFCYENPHTHRKDMKGS